MTKEMKNRNRVLGECLPQTLADLGTDINTLPCQCLLGKTNDSAL